MSFIDIKDPKKRDAIVADYLAPVKKIQQRNLNEGAQELIRQDDTDKMIRLKEKDACLGTNVQRTPMQIKTW